MSLLSVPMLVSFLVWMASRLRSLLLVQHCRKDFLVFVFMADAPLLEFILKCLLFISNELFEWFVILSSEFVTIGCKNPLHFDFPTCVHFWLLPKSSGSKFEFAWQNPLGQQEVSNTNQQIVHGFYLCHLKVLKEMKMFLWKKPSAMNSEFSYFLVYHSNLIRMPVNFIHCIWLDR